MNHFICFNDWRFRLTFFEQIGTPGHAVVSSINSAVQEWAKINLKTAYYHMKGNQYYEHNQLKSSLAFAFECLIDKTKCIRCSRLMETGMNCLTEMYSAVEAEVVLKDDPATGVDERFLGLVLSADQVSVLNRET